MGGGRPLIHFSHTLEMPSMEFACESSHQCHKLDIHALVMNETRMFTASKDTSVKVCDAASGEELHAMEGHSYDVNTLLLVGNTLFSGADAKGATREYLKAWNAETGAVHTRSLDGHGGGVWALAADTDSKLLFSGGDDRTIRVWNLGTYECLHTLEGHEAKVRCLYYEEGRLYSGGHDSKVLVWDTATWEVIATFDGQGGFITALLVDGDTLYCASADKTVFVRDKKTGEKKSVLNNDAWVCSMSMVESTLFVGLGDGSIRAWNPQDATVLCTLKGHEEHNAVSAMAVQGETLFSAGWDGLVSRWNVPELHQKIAEQAQLSVEAAEINVEKGSGVEILNVDEGSMFDDVDCDLE